MHLHAPFLFSFAYEWRQKSGLQDRSSYTTRHNGVARLPFQGSLDRVLTPRFRRDCSECVRWNEPMLSSAPWLNVPSLDTILFSSRASHGVSKKRRQPKSRTEVPAISARTRLPHIGWRRGTCTHKSWIGRHRRSQTVRTGNTMYTHIFRNLLCGRCTRAFRTCNRAIFITSCA